MKVKGINPYEVYIVINVFAVVVLYWDLLEYVLRP